MVAFRQTAILPGLSAIYRSRIARILLFLLAVWLLHVYTTSARSFRRPQIGVTTSLVESQVSTLSDPATGLLNLADAARFCGIQQLQPWPHRDKRRKVYDLLMVNNEMDWLEIRLSTLASVVDYFVIVESPVTFTGLDKPLALDGNWERFREWHPQIIRHTLVDPPLGRATRTWDFEDYQRNAMFNQTFPRMEEEKKGELGDVLLVSDVDEIPRPITVMMLRNCDAGRRVTIRSQFYYYGFQWRHIGVEWAHPQATTFAGEDTILPSDLRNGEGGNRIKAWWEKKELHNAGWHCSTCFQTVGEVLNKMSSFSHSLLNAEKFRDPVRIIDRVRRGLDLWDRKGEMYERMEDNEDIPEVLNKDKKRWAYLLERDGPNAGFTDFGINPVGSDP